MTASIWSAKGRLVKVNTPWHRHTFRVLFSEDMIRSLKRLLGSRLAASDGEIGPVKDFYLDVQNWAVRYVVADAGSWLPDRQVLISPYALGGLTEVGMRCPMNLTRKEVESSPWMQTGQLISRAYEENYHQYYGWPPYWHGDGLWGLSEFPVLPLTESLSSEPIISAGERPPEREEPQLQSTRVIQGYTLRTRDGARGHLCDFLMDDKSWAIGQLVVKTGRRFSGQEVEIPTKKVDRISSEESTVFVSLTREALEQSPEHPSAPGSAASINQNREGDKDQRNDCIEAPKV